MTMIRHELKMNRISFIVWTCSISFLLIICIFLFPEMKGEMDGVSDLFASMGSFTEAFGMDKVNFGTLSGFYAVECGNIMGLGGAFFAAMLAVSALSKEEKEHTAEFLLTHPKSRFSIITEKLIAVMIQILLLNMIAWALGIASIAIIGEKIPMKEITLMHGAYLFLQLELAGICFGLSAFLRKGSIGIGLGVAIILYFCNIIANISDSASFLNKITPFGYADGAQIVSEGSLDILLIALGLIYGVVGIMIGYIKYIKKDIQ